MSSYTKRQEDRCKLLYERGSSISDIERRIGVNRRSIESWIEKYDWKKVESSLDDGGVEVLDNIVESKELLLEKELKRYSNKVLQIENMVNASLLALGNSPSQVRSVSRSESERVCSILKSLKLASEIAFMNHQGYKKSLGLDVIEHDKDLKLLPLNIGLTKKDE